MNALKSYQVEFWPGIQVIVEAQNEHSAIEIAVKEHGWPGSQEKQADGWRFVAFVNEIPV